MMSHAISTSNIRTLALTALVLTTGCAARELPHPPGEFRGVYTEGFEVSSFELCGSGEQWWVLPDEELHERYGHAAGEGAKYAYVPVYVRLRGNIGPPGDYGHLGAYQRELAVSEVLDVREAGEEGCG